MYYVMSLVTCTIANLDSRSSPKGRVRKKEPEKMWSFAQLGGGGSRMVVKCESSILEKYFFGKHVESF